MANWYEIGYQEGISGGGEGSPIADIGTAILGQIYAKKERERLLREEIEKEKRTQQRELEKIEATEKAKATYKTPSLLESAQADYLKSLIKPTLPSGENGEIPEQEKTDILIKMGISPEEQEDYEFIPTVKSFKGMPTTIITPRKKQQLQPKQISDIAGLEKSASILTKNLKTLQEKGFEIGPGLVTQKGTIGNLAAQYLRPPEFSAWKASVDKAFQEYRKYITGVQAAYPEIRILSPDFPQPTDRHDVFVQKTLDSVKDIEENRQRIIDYFGQSGYAVSKLKKRGIVESPIIPGLSPAGGEVPQIESQFIEGKIYTDAQGNKARYQNGQWIPVR